MTRLRALWSRTRFLRAAVAAGAVGGLVAGGIGGRLVMRLMALVDSETDGQLTDSGATVGAITLGGSLQLVLVTMIAGVVGGLLYVGIRRWIPATRVPKGLVFGLLVMIVPGIIVFNPDNPDFQLFEPVLLLHGLFVGIFLVYGMMVVAVTEALDPAPVRASSPGHARWALAREVAVLVVLLGLHVFMAGGMLEGEGTCLAVDGRGGCALRPTPVEDSP
jgi:hypothetical protein